MNKKINIALILLIIGLISSINTVNASLISEPIYELGSHDVTVKQGKTTTIKAYVSKYNPSSTSEGYLPTILFIFTIKNNAEEILGIKTAKASKNLDILISCAVCKFNTSKMPKGNHKLTITCYIPENNAYKILEKDYKFNVI